MDWGTEWGLNCYRVGMDWGTEWGLNFTGVVVRDPSVPSSKHTASLL